MHEIGYKKEGSSGKECEGGDEPGETTGKEYDGHGKVLGAFGKCRARVGKRQMTFCSTLWRMGSGREYVLELKISTEREGS